MKRIKGIMKALPVQLKLYVMIIFFSGSVLLLMGAGGDTLNVTVDVLDMNGDAFDSKIAIGAGSSGNGGYTFSAGVNCGGEDVTTNALTSFQWVSGGSSSTKGIVTTSAGRQVGVVHVKHIYTVGTETCTNTGTGSNEVHVIAMSAVSGPAVVAVGVPNVYTGYSTGGVSQSDFPFGWPQWKKDGEPASSTMSFSPVVFRDR